MLFFFFNDTATTEIYTLSLHDALPISARRPLPCHRCCCPMNRCHHRRRTPPPARRRRCPSTPHPRSEEHTSELQSRQYLVCRLLLEKKKQYINVPQHHTSNITLQCTNT